MTSNNRRYFLWLALVLLVGLPLSGLFLIGTAELILCLALLTGWLVLFFTWAKPGDHAGRSSGA